MARKKDASSSTRDSASSSASGPPPSNGPDDAQMQALFFQHKKTFEARLAAKKKADADFKNACKLAKSELGKSAIDDIKTAIKMDAEGGEAAVIEDIQAKLRVARWVGAAFGHQFEMFDGPDRTPAVDRAYDAGRRAGLAGEPARPPHDPSTEQYGKWMEGHHVGNEQLARATFKPLEPKGDAEADEASSGERVSSSEFKRRLNEMTDPNKAQEPAPIGDQPSTATIQG